MREVCCAAGFQLGPGVTGGKPDPTFYDGTALGEQQNAPTASGVEFNNNVIAITARKRSSKYTAKISAAYRSLFKWGNP
jgi:hypothetical protein